MRRFPRCGGCAAGDEALAAAESALATLEPLGESELAWAVQAG